MKKIGSREFKNRFGAYLTRVKRGERLSVTDRGRVVAHVIPATPADPISKSADEILEELAAAGHISNNKGEFAPGEPVPAKGKPASRIILEDRR